jgi:hypothetical protein
LRALRDVQPLPETAADAETEGERARAAARAALDESRSLGLSVFAHAVDTVAAHAARAAAAAEGARVRRARGSFA